MHNTGQAGGTVDADIDAPEAWEIFTGSSSIVVAVLDTGIDYYHVDLASNIWINEDEIPNNEIDDDKNGYVDDFRGWNFVADNNNPMDDCSVYYHGTHVAGTIGAVGNNGEGVTGVNWNVKIMAVKFLDENGWGSEADAVHAVDYSIENGARISNNSYGGPSYSQSMLYAISRAWTAGQLFVAAAGNEGDDTDITPSYPACYPLGNIISVAATSNKDELSPLSNYGVNTVDLGAPGGYWESINEPPDDNDIYSTKRYDNYQFLAGTSMAAPHVTGVAALVWGYRPDIGFQGVKHVIMNGVDEQGSLSGKVVTDGRLNAYNALELAPSLPPLPQAPSNLRVEGFCWDVKLTWQDNSANEDGFYIYRKSGDAFYLLEYVEPNVTTYWDRDLWCGQLWCYKVTAYNLSGESSPTYSRCTKTLPCLWCEK